MAVADSVLAEGVVLAAAAPREAGSMSWKDLFRNPALNSQAEELHKLEALLPQDAAARLTAQVAASERKHSGEIRICLEYAMPRAYEQAGYSARDRALTLFSELHVWDTEHNNGILLYVLMQHHAIEIVADRGFNRHVPQAAWAAIAHHMAPHLRDARLEQALAAALAELTELLSTHFPPNPALPRLNELPDSPVLLG